jgi:hypothetical protein
LRKKNQLQNGLMQSQVDHRPVGKSHFKLNSKANTKLKKNPNCTLKALGNTSSRQHRKLEGDK